MKITKVIKELQKYVDVYGENVRVNFKMVAPETIWVSDEMDIPINYIGEIGTSMLDNPSEPRVEIGFKYYYKEDNIFVPRDWGKPRKVNEKWLEIWQRNQENRYNMICLESYGLVIMVE